MSEARKLIEAESPKGAFKQFPRLSDYHFSLGNSSNGPIGYCARIRAHSRDEALAILKEVLPESVEVPYNHMDGRIGYIEVYLNPEALTVQDIDEEEPYVP